MVSASGLAPGERLGKYQLEHRLGAGGMGEVWAAHDPDLDRRVAIKVLRPGVAVSDEAHARLLREGRAMARLRHANVITVHEATSSEGRDLIVMELVDGTSLDGWLAGPRRPAEIVATLVAAGRGLAAAHDGGMIHRDFKPHNVLVDRDGRVLVTDFGLARAMATEPVATDPSARGAGAPAAHAVVAVAAFSSDVALDVTAVATPTSSAATTASEHGRSLSSPLTREGSLLGTPAYMAPEQLDGRADARSDQYAFCVTAWEAFTGTRPFAGKHVAELHAEEAPSRPAHAERVPRRLRAIFARGLAREPAERWPSVAVLLAAIERAWRRPRRIAIAAALAVVGVGIGVAFAIVGPASGAAASPCPQADLVLASAWSPAVRGRVERALADHPERDRVVGFFDRWATGWRELHDQTCDAPDAPEFLIQRSCLQALRDELAVMMTSDEVPVDVLARAPLSLTIPPAAVCATNPRAIAPTIEPSRSDPLETVVLSGR